mgnify:CR=1 FL=1
MRSLYLRIAVVFAIALVFCVAAMWIVSVKFWGRTVGDFFASSMRYQQQQAIKAYEAGGPQQLATYLAETDAAFRGDRYLTDAKGRDLVTGVDRSSMLRFEHSIFGGPKRKNGKVTIPRRSGDGRYYFVVVATPPISLISFVPYFIIIVLVTAALAWGLSLGIVAPLLKVAGTVERFGRGDLSARIATKRKDEIGTVARSFDSMAERIQTLLAAERRLLQDVSHELRSPLARLSFATALMKDAKDPDAAIERVKREVDRLSGMVSTLVDMASAEGDFTSLKRQRIDAKELVNDIVEVSAIEAEGHHVRIENTTESSAPVEGDPELLRRAVENVLRNAIRYSPRNGSVSVHTKAEDGAVTIAVRDYGPGVPEDKLPNIFNPFYRVEDARESTSGGVGLGLSIARRAVLLHHGTIRAENAVPGLLVQMTIPIAQPQSH